MVKCSNCGAELREYYEYCLKCNAYNPLSEREVVKFCLQCGMENLETSIYCKECGNLLSLPKTTVSASEKKKQNVNNSFTKKGKTKPQYKQKNRNKNSSNVGLIVAIILVIFVVILIVDWRWLVALFVVGFLVLLGWGMEGAEKAKKVPSNKQKQHKDQMWARRNIRQGFKRRR